MASPTAVLDALPEPGQVVGVRGATWVVTDVQQQSLPRSAQDDAVQQLQHAVTLQSVEEDRLGHQLRVVWELEPGRTLGPRRSSPRGSTPTASIRPNGWPRSSTRSAGERSPALTTGPSRRRSAPAQRSSRISSNRSAARSPARAPTCCSPMTSGSARPSRPAWSSRNSFSATGRAPSSSSARRASA